MSEGQEVRACQEGFAWHLACQRKYDPRLAPPEITNPTDYSLVIGAPISDERYAEFSSSHGLLSEALTASAYASLRSRYNEFRRIFDEVTDALEDRRFGSQSAQLVEPLPRKLDDLLSALRGFGDRTSHALSRRYGKDSGQLTAFKRALSHEYDNNFAYRFSWHLRNYSQHCGNPIASTAATARLRPDGSTEREFNPTFDSNALVTNYDKWPTRVREDLERINGRFPVGSVVDSLMSSCSRAYGKSLLAQSNHIWAAVEAIRTLAHEAATEDDDIPFLAYVKATAESVDLHKITLSPIRSDLAAAAESAIQQAKVIVGST